MVVDRTVKVYTHAIVYMLVLMAKMRLTSTLIVVWMWTVMSMDVDRYVGNDVDGYR